MKFSVYLMFVLLAFNTAAKKLKLYQCQQADGTLVTQDRRCEVTRLESAKTEIKSAKKTATQSKVKTSKSPVYSKVPNSRAVQNYSGAPRARSPYFLNVLEDFTPRGWMIHQEKLSWYHQLYYTQTKINTASQFKTGIELTVYPKTNQTQRQNAFAKALEIYHDIREKYQQRLLNSHFKSHARFKIFNIEYKINNGVKAFTEFYIDEANNDLFVLTIQASAQDWEHHQQMADMLMSWL